MLPLVTLMVAVIAIENLKRELASSHHHGHLQDDEMDKIVIPKKARLEVRSSDRTNASFSGSSPSVNRNDEEELESDSWTDQSKRSKKTGAKVLSGNIEKRQSTNMTSAIGSQASRNVFSLKPNNEREIPKRHSGSTDSSRHHREQHQHHEHGQYGQQHHKLSSQAQQQSSSRHRTIQKSEQKAIAYNERPLNPSLLEKVGCIDFLILSGPNY
jgi:ABC-type nickel/cobalt efflux system permease component RcnA